MSKQLPCSSCGIDLAAQECAETTALVDVTDVPILTGRKGQREVPAWICPECEHVQPL